MIEITFREFFEYQYHENGFHELYIMKNGLDQFFILAFHQKISGIAGLARGVMLWRGPTI